MSELTLSDEATVAGQNETFLPEYRDNGIPIHCLDFTSDTTVPHFAAVQTYLGEDAAKRIAACWNVCDGISTSVLELNATAGGIATLERQRDNYRAVLEGAEYQNLDAMGAQRPADSRRVGEMAKQCVLDLHAQRDELLAAFEEVLRISDRKHDAWDRAHAAIAKAKGGAQ